MSEEKLAVSDFLDSIRAYIVFDVLVSEEDFAGSNSYPPPRGCRQKSLLQIITARSWQAAKYDAALFA